MEYDTLAETGEKLPKFAGQLGVPAADLRRMINDDWLPHVDVVQLPASMRQADPRALEVRDRDRNDFPAAAVAALLSPCLLLTRNYKHFGVLGVGMPVVLAEKSTDMAPGLPSTDAAKVSPEPAMGGCCCFRSARAGQP